MGTRPWPLGCAKPSPCSGGAAFLCWSFTPGPRYRPGTPNSKTILASPPTRTFLLKTKDRSPPDSPSTSRENLGSAALAWAPSCHQASSGRAEGPDSIMSYSSDDQNLLGLTRGSLGRGPSPHRCQVCKGNTPAGKTQGRWNPGASSVARTKPGSAGL